MALDKAQHKRGLADGGLAQEDEFELKDFT